MTGKTYLLVTLSLLAAVLAPGVGLNLMLGSRAMGGAEITRMASDWQQQTRGVTYSPPIINNGPFKILRLHDRLPEINALVFGSSSVMGITAAMFPEHFRIYNFAEAGNGLRSSIGEAESARANFGDRIRLIVIAVDWSIGFLFASGEPHAFDLSREAALKMAPVPEAPFYLRLADALSLPKVENLGAVLLEVARSGDKVRTFRQIFFEPSGDEYVCPDGSRAKDFDILYRGKCGGFYYDGSSRFSAWKRIRANEVQQLVLAGSTSNSKYALSLQSTKGNPNPVFLDRIARLNREMSRAGGMVIVLVPPLIPGLEERLSKAQPSGANLRRMRDALSGWAQREKLILIDAGTSERFGCQPLEFLDEHHAMRECYEKVFDRFWRDYRRGLAPGRYAIQGSTD
jgi:hypothetical protein